MIDDELYRLLVRARTRWRHSPGHIDECSLDEGTGKPIDPVLFLNLSDNPGVNGYENRPILETPTNGENYRQ